MQTARQDILREIVRRRREDIEVAKRSVPLSRLEEMASARTHHSLVERCRHPGTAIIAEMKKASPSAGLLRARYEPAATATLYSNAGAAGISVLTEPHYFLGDEAHFREVRETVEIPLLRKDFIVDPYQIVESVAWGADLILLIVAAVDPALLADLHAEAVGRGLEVLVEAHTEGELDAALALERAIVGVNSRNLRTLRTDLGVAERLARRIPPGRLAIAESGIRTRSDVEQLEAMGYRGFLIGETLMRSPSPAETLRELLGAVPPA